MSETLVEQVASAPNTARSRARRVRVRVRQFVGFVGYVVLSFIFAVLLLEFGSFVVLSVYRWARPPLLTESSPVYREYPWASEYWKEEKASWNSQQAGYEPFRIWGVAPSHTQYTNTDDTPNGSRRKTVNPANDCGKQPNVKVWMFGGSTVYGVGVPDWGTLPSALSHELNSAALGCVVVTNFGVEGYDSNQEVLLLMEQLKAGKHPDVVIFYDGVNDSYVGAVDPGMANGHLFQSTVKVRVEGRLDGRLDFLRDSYALRLAKAAGRFLHWGGRGEIVSQPGDEDSQTKAVATVNNYEGNLRIVRALGDAYGFRVFCFWQPALVYGQKPLDSYETALVGIKGAREAVEAQGVVYQEAARRAARDGQFAFLGSIFDSVHESVYVDRWMHLSPRGNEMVARTVASYVVEKMKAPVGSQ